MNTMRYEKPALEFVSLRNDNEVAATCWGNHGKDVYMYCDIPGVGYMSFQIGGGSCALNLINVRYHETKGSEGEFVYDGDAPYEALELLLKDAGGSNGNPYKDSNVVIVEKPDPTWS